MSLIYDRLGYTLIELLVVMAVIALLATIGLVTYNSTTLVSHDTTRYGNMRQVVLALEMYYNQNGSYPPGAYDSRDPTGWGTFSSYLVPTYIKSLPLDPKNNSGEGYMCGNCGEYFYKGYTDHYILSTYLANNDQKRTGNRCDLDSSSRGTAACNVYAPYFSVGPNCAVADFWDCQ